MRRNLLATGIAVAAVLLIVPLTALVLPLMLDADRFHPTIEAELARTLGRDVKIGRLNLRVFSGTVSATDLSIADDPSFSRTPFLRAKSVKLSIDLWQALVSRKMRVSGMSIDSPQIVLAQGPAGTWNFSSIRPRAPNSDPILSIKSLQIDHAHLSVAQAGTKPEIVDDLSLHVTDFSPGAIVPFTLSANNAGGGDISMEGKAGPLNLADLADTPIQAAFKVTNTNRAASGAAPADSGIDGLISMDGTLQANGQALAVAGRIKAEKLKLARGATSARNPLLVDLALTADLKQHTGQITRCVLSLAGMKAGLTGTWSRQREATVLQAVLTAPGVPVSGLMELLPTLAIEAPSGITLEGGSAAAELTISGPLSALVVRGPVSLVNTRLKGFDWGANMSPIEKLAGIKSGPNTEIQSLSAVLRIAPQGAGIQDIHLVLPAIGVVTGSGTIGPNRGLNFKMKAAVHGGLFLAPLTASDIPFSITGSMSNPQFQPDVGQLATQQVGRGLQGFKAGGVDVGKTVDEALQGLLGAKKKK